MFDETFGEPVARAALGLLEYDSTITIEPAFMRKWIGEGVKDNVWAKRAGKEGWFVLTCDRGKTQDGAPLDLLLPYHGVSAAFLTPTLHGRKQFEKLRAVLSLWPKIMRGATGPSGIRYSMGIRAVHNDDDGFSWREWPLTEKQKKRQSEVCAPFPDKLWPSQ